MNLDEDFLGQVFGFRLTHQSSQIPLHFRAMVSFCYPYSGFLAVIFALNTAR